MDILKKIYDICAQFTMDKAAGLDLLRDNNPAVQVMTAILWLL